MAFIIPWIFRAGTKAKSAEVNENFLAVKQFVDLLEDDIATNQISVQTLEDTKANINGNPTERFQVANGIVGNDAVNMNTLEKNTQNVRGYIDGYTLSATNKVITASKGSCYSYNGSEYQYLIKSTTSIQTGTLSLASNTKYYVYVWGDSSGANFPKLTAENKTTPTVKPQNTDCYRRIGYFFTDNNGNITSIYKEGEKVIPSRVGFITSYLGTIAGFVDDDGKDYIAEQDLYLYVQEIAENNGIEIYIWLGGTKRQVGALGSGGVGDYDSTSLLIPIKKGQKYNITAHKNANWKAYKYGMGG